MRTVRQTVSSLTLACTLATLSPQAFAYDFPTAADNKPVDPNLASLEAISHGVSTIARDASKAVVLVSTAKTVHGQSLDRANPFDFFFGPGSPFGNGGPGGHGGPGGPGGPGGRGGRGLPQGPQDGPDRKQEGLGSGFIVDLDKGYIITNNHVVEGADTITVKIATGDALEAKVIGRDARTDVAVVQIDPKTFKKDGLGVLPLADSTKVQSGDFAVALGAPFGLETSISFGVISATGRGNLSIAELGDFIQTDAAINPGNSGGPLLNTAGQVIGMNTAIYSSSGAYNGIGFAVPSNLVKRIASVLIDGGKIDRGYIGVQLQPMDPAMAKDLNLPDGTHGALVAKVEHDGPAAKAGVEAGDVITAVDDTAVKSQSELSNVIGLTQPGKGVKLSLLRDGKKKTVEVKLARFPDKLSARRGGDQDNEGDAETLAKKGSFGLALAPVTPDSKEHYGLESRQGALVQAVANGSPAERAGLQPGDAIVLAAGKKVGSPEDFVALTKGKDKVLLRVERAGNFFFVSIKKTANQGNG